MKEERRKRETRRITLRGADLLHNPIYNKGTAFSREERKAFHLWGLLPWRITTIEEQCQRMHENISRKKDPLEQYIGLLSLQNRNETLFYRFLQEHTEEFLPIVYTPTVGQACQEFSHIFRNSRGVWITPEDKGRMDEIFENHAKRDVRLIVVTDNERILGLGDQGAGGMGIPIGKVVLYTLGAGIHPSKTLPICLDVGTDNEDLLRDPMYLGWPEKRLRGKPYDEMIENFVMAVRRHFPRALLQWEDFKKNTAFTLLDRYQERLLSFNDDIQGTAGVMLAGILAANRVSGLPLREQRVLVLGGGAAGVGISRLLRKALKREGLEGSSLQTAIAIVDSQGFLLEGRERIDKHKRDFCWPVSLARKFGIEGRALNNLEDLVAAYKPTVLLGTSGQPGVFTEKLVRTMAANVKRPAIFPLSNPNSKCEANPKDLVEWTDGRALIGTGSPFPPYTFKGKTYRFSQANNVYVFPGVGLGALVAEATRVTSEMFFVAAQALADSVPEEELRNGMLYPSLSNLRDITATIAEAVVREARDSKLGRPLENEQIPEEVKDFMWFPDYSPYEAG